MARTRSAGVHGDRARTLGGAFGPSVSGLRTALANGERARRARTLVSVARQLRGTALRVRSHHAHRAVDPSIGLRGSRTHVVDGGVLDPVLAPHRARAPSGA